MLLRESLGEAPSMIPGVNARSDSPSAGHPSGAQETGHRSSLEITMLGSVTMASAPRRGAPPKANQTGHSRPGQRPKSLAFLLLASASALAIGFASQANAQATQARPNIVLIIADDLGWTDLSTGRTSEGNGSRYHQTPNIDKLAAAGMAFTSAYANQNCQPSRAALMTGQYAPHNGVYNVGSLARKVAGKTLALTPPGQSVRIRPDAVTLAETLKKSGYQTAHVGKFHVSASAEAMKTEHGYDFNYGGGIKGDGVPAGYFARQGPQRGWHFNSRGVEMDTFASPYTAEYIAKNITPFANGTDTKVLEGTPKHLTDADADAAIDFIAKHQSGADQKTPFYLDVGFGAVHVAVRPRPDLAAKYDRLKSTDPRQKKAGYAALTEGMDQSIGRILARLEDPNGDGDKSDSIVNNTLVVFISDNGGFQGSTDNTPLRGGKGMFSEGGLRIPLIARLPGRIAANSLSDAPVHLIDLYPTFAAIAKAPLPETKTYGLDGVSFAGVLTGKEKNPTGREALYWHFPGYLDTRSIPCSVILKDIGDSKSRKRYKLMYFYEDRHYELYCLTDDLSEKKNLLATATPPTGPLRSVAENLRTDLVNWLTRVTPAYPSDPATKKPVSPPVPLLEAHYGGPRFEGRTGGASDD
jgi:arylsulfatase A-like enzyme